MTTDCCGVHWLILSCAQQQNVLTYAYNKTASCASPTVLALVQDMSPDQLQRLLITAMTLMGRNGTQDGTCSTSNYAKPIGITALKPLLSKATSCASIDALVHATCQRCCPSSMRVVQPNKYCQLSTIRCALKSF